MSADNGTYVKPRLLDLFCGAGGAAMGYHRAGFDVVGVDICPQPRYPFEFDQGDALTWPLDGYDAIHASPPCQDHSAIGGRDGRHGTGWMLAATVQRVKAAGVPWIVENVVSPDVQMAGWWFTLCGSSFGLKVRRHRRFGSNVLMLAPGCRHDLQGTPLGVYGGGGHGPSTRPAGGGGTKARRQDYAEIMDMPWAKWPEIAQAIPPAYTAWIGAQLIEAL